MIRILGLRLIQAAVTLFAVSFLVYLAGDYTGDPVSNYLDPTATEDQRIAVAQEFGLDKPVLERYGIFLKNAVQGDFGKSFKTKQPVFSLVMDRVGNTIFLILIAKLITLAVAVPLGVYAAVHRGTLGDTLARGFALFWQAVPGFWVAIMAILLFAVGLHLVPAAGNDSWKSYILPAGIIGLGTSAGLLRIIRSSMIEALESDYARLARSKGVSEARIIWVHALRNSAIPAMTLFGISLGTAIAAGVTIEVVFAWPGLGRLVVDAVSWGDYPTVLAAVMFYATVIIVVNLIVDLSYTVVDPRVRL